jgi:hypothetical protein
MLVLRARPHHIEPRWVRLRIARITIQHLSARADDHHVCAGLNPIVAGLFLWLHTGRCCLHRRPLRAVHEPHLFDGGSLCSIQAVAIASRFYRRTGHRERIVWFFRLPDASYWVVQIATGIDNSVPTREPLDPDRAARLERLWRKMGRKARGRKIRGWHYASQRFSGPTDDILFLEEMPDRLH